MGFTLHFCMKVALTLGLYDIAIASPLADQVSHQVPMAALPNTKSLKVPGASPAYHCDDPSDDIFQITGLDFVPTNPRV